MKALTSIYAAMLTLYPRSFREDYRDEMLDVFKMRLEDAGGIIQLTKIMFGEIIALPSSILTVGKKEWRKTMNAQLKKFFDPAEGSLHEILLASLPIIFMYIVPGLITGIPGLEDAIPQVVGLALIIFMSGTLVVLGIFGLFAGLPRWSLFYAGILLNALILLILAGISSVFLRDIVSNGQVYIPVFFGLYVLVYFIVGFVGLWLSARINEFRWFFDKVKKDWLLLSLVSYAGAFGIILLQYEDLHGYSWPMSVTGLLLLAGLIQFFRAKKSVIRLMGFFLWPIFAVVITGGAIQDFVQNIYPQSLLYNDISVTGYLIILLLANIIILLMPVLFSRIKYSGVFLGQEGQTLLQE